MNRVRSGFHDSNGEFVTADARVEYRFGGRRGTVNAIFQTGEAEVIFDDDADLWLVEWDHICKLPPWAEDKSTLRPDGWSLGGYPARWPSVSRLPQHG